MMFQVLSIILSSTVVAASNNMQFFLNVQFVRNIILFFAAPQYFLGAIYSRALFYALHGTTL